MGIVNWRREGLFLIIAGMETCWLVGWSRVLLTGLGADIPGLAWWSVIGLYVVALITARTLGRLGLRRGAWIIGGLALLTSMLLLQVNLDGSLQLLRDPSDPSTAIEVLTLLTGFLIWFRALRIPARAGDTRAIIRQFQIGVLIVVGLVLATLQFPVPVSEIVLAYFGLGLLAVALTRIEEVARNEPSGAAPLNLKWIVTLLATLLVAGAVTLLVTHVFSVETVRRLLEPLGSLFRGIVYAFVVIATALLMQLFRLIAPLLQNFFAGVSAEDVEQSLQELRQSIESSEQEELTATPLFGPELFEALKVIFFVLLILVVVWLVVRSFRRWRMYQYATPGGTREKVTPEGTLAQDLAEFLQDRWRRLQQAADLRRIFTRLGSDSVRAIYANLLAMLAAADRPRQPEQTPYEYEPVAEEALPTRETDIRAITEAYVRVRYGEEETNPEELARMQDAWKRIKAEGKKLL